MSTKKRFFIVAIPLLAQFLIHFPDWFRWQNTPADKWFTGQVSWFDPWDINLYLAAIGRGERGGFLLENLYDTESSVPLPMYFVYILMGKANLFLNLSNSLIFHLAGIITSGILAIIIWYFIKIFLKQDIERMAAFTLIFLGGGLGWLFPDLFPADIGQPGFTIFNALRRPHEALSLGFFILVMVFYYKGVIYGNNRYFYLGGMSLFLAGFLHPYNFLSLGLIVFGFQFLYLFLKNIKTDVFKTTFSFAFVILSWYFLIGKSLITNSSFSGLLVYNRSSSSLFQIILGFGTLLPFALTDMFTGNNTNKNFFLKLWFGTLILIILLPTGFQRLLARSIWIPFSILAVNGIRKVAEKIKIKLQYIIIPIIILSLFSLIFISYKRIVENHGNQWIYLSKDEGNMIKYLNDNGDDGEGVLASYLISNIIPAHTNKKVWIGHIDHSPRFQERIIIAENLFSGILAEDEAKLILKNAKISWVFWGTNEKSIGHLKNFPYPNIVETKMETTVVSLFKVR